METRQFTRPVFYTESGLVISSFSKTQMINCPRQRHQLHIGERSTRDRNACRQFIFLICKQLGMLCSLTGKRVRMTVISHVVCMRSVTTPTLIPLVQKQVLAMVSNSKFQDGEMKKMGTSYQQAQ